MNRQLVEPDPAAELPRFLHLRPPPSITRGWCHDGKHQPNRASYNADAAKLARTRTLEFLREHLGGRHSGIRQSFPYAEPAPIDDAFALAQINALNDYLCSTGNGVQAHRMRRYGWADDSLAIAPYATESATVGG